MIEVIFLNINAGVLVSMTEAEQDFSKAASIADTNGIAVIMKNDRQRYIMLSFQEEVTPGAPAYPVF